LAAAALCPADADALPDDALDDDSIFDGSVIIFFEVKSYAAGLCEIFGIRFLRLHIIPHDMRT
jgi:hypothetical protein